MQARCAKSSSKGLGLRHQHDRHVREPLRSSSFSPNAADTSLPAYAGAREREIDERVDRFYGLTLDEINIIEDTR